MGKRTIIRKNTAKEDIGAKFQLKKKESLLLKAVGPVILIG